MRVVAASKTKDVVMFFYEHDNELYYRTKTKGVYSSFVRNTLEIWNAFENPSLVILKVVK